MTKGCIYYTDNRLDPLIMKTCQEQLKNSFKGEIVSISLKPINFGENIVLNERRSVITMLRQICLGLEKLTTDIVFFTEHDVLYHKSHFDFTPSDTYCYNTNVWRWQYPEDRLITYDGLKSLSGLCVKRDLAVEHYKKRLAIVEKNGWNLRYGFEPGTKRKRNGGITDETSEVWKSEYPNIDIRHKKTLTPPKFYLSSFKHEPKNWQVASLDEIVGWDLYKLFNIKRI